MARSLPFWIICLLLLPCGAVFSGPPAVLVDDTTRAMPAELQAELQKELSAFHAETGVLLAVKTVIYLESGETMRSAARVARQALGTEGPAALIMLDRGKNGLRISQSPELWQRYPLDDLVGILRDALAMANTEGRSLNETLVTVSRKWMTEIRRLEQERQIATRLVPGREIPLLIGFALLLGLGGLGAHSLANRERRRLHRDTERFPFPEISVGERLGAPYGGGRIAQWSQPDG